MASTSHDALGLCNKILTLSICASNIFEYLFEIIQKSMEGGEVPECINTSKVIPLTKVPVPCGPTQLRPIALQPVIGKLIERCVYTQLLAFVNSNSILTDRQFGFRAKHSTPLCTLKLL
jgi:hypothetical protein